MKKGILCNEVRIIDVKKQEGIRYEFVTGDREIPSVVVVKPGDTDPATGEKITEVEWFQDYYHMQNREIYKNLQAVRPGCVLPGEKERRREEGRKLAEEFRLKYGYDPSPEDLCWLLDERWPHRTVVSMDSFVNDAGDSFADCIPAFADPAAEDAFDRVEFQDLLRDIRSFADGLEGRMKDVCLQMLRKAAGEEDVPTVRELGKRWGVSKDAIERDRKRLAKMIREYLIEE